MGIRPRASRHLQARKSAPATTSSGRVWRRNGRKPVMTIAVAVLAFGLTLFIIVDQRLKPTLLQIAEARATVIATQAINRAVNERISRTMKYEDLYMVRTDNRGRVVLMQPNTGEINRLASDTTIQVQEVLRSVSEEKIRVPLGQVFGSQLLASLGPWIAVRVVPIGTVETAVLDRFEAMGINQSRHKVYMQVKASVKIVVPLVSSYVQVRTELPIAEGLILGEVPQVYFGLTDKTFGQLIKSQDLAPKSTL